VFQVLEEELDDADSELIMAFAAAGVSATASCSNRVGHRGEAARVRMMKLSH
jgi:hypothetical protein